MTSSRFKFNPDLLSLIMKTVFLLSVGYILSIGGWHELAAAKIEVHKKNIPVYFENGFNWDSILLMKDVWIRILLGYLLGFIYLFKLVKFFSLPSDKRPAYLKRERYIGTKSYRIHFFLVVIVLVPLLLFVILALVAITWPELGLPKFLLRL